MLPLLLSFLASAASAAPAPKPIEIGGWVGADDYPGFALRTGLEGAVGYRLKVDAAGHVTDCTIMQPSGHPALDQPTCDLLLQRARFVAAADRKGRPVSSVYDGRIRWQLPPPLPAIARTPFAAPGASQSAAEKTPDPIVDPAAIAPPADPRVTFGRLPNGLRYAILANATPRGAVSFRFRVGVGSVDEKPSEAGYAHLVEHMMFRGSTNVPEGEFERSLEKVGLAMGSDTTAFTYPETTVYGLDFPPGDQSGVNTGLFLLREVADRALIPAASLAAERGVVLSEKRVRDTASLRMDVARLNFLLPGQPVSRPSVGTAATIGNATADQLRAFTMRITGPTKAC